MSGGTGTGDSISMEDALTREQKLKDLVRVVKEIARPKVGHSELATFMPCTSFDKCWSKRNLTYDSNKCEIKGFSYVGNCRHIAENSELSQS